MRQTAPRMKLLLLAAFLVSTAQPAHAQKADDLNPSCPTAPQRAAVIEDSTPRALVPISKDQKCGTQLEALARCQIACATAKGDKIDQTTKCEPYQEALGYCGKGTGMYRAFEEICKDARACDSFGCRQSRLALLQCWGKPLDPERAVRPAKTPSGMPSVARDGVDPNNRAAAQPYVPPVYLPKEASPSATLAPVQPKTFSPGVMPANPAPKPNLGPMDRQLNPGFSVSPRPQIK